MAKKIRWSSDFTESLEHYTDYIAADSQSQAIKFTLNIFDLVDNIADHPMIGRMVPEYGDEKIREMIYRKNYRIVYEISGNYVDLLIVHNAAKPLPDSL